MRNLLSEGDFEGKDRTGFGFTEVPTLLANSFFNPFPHELRVANAISKNRSQLSIVFAGVFQHSARGREGERPNRQQEIHNKLINNKYEKAKQRESTTWPRQGSCEGDRARVSSSLHEF